MARNYSLNGTNATAGTTTLKTVIQLHGSTLARTRVFDLTLGSIASPNDYVTEWALSRYTAAGTVTPQTPYPTDPADPAAAAVGGASATGVNASAEPTGVGLTTSVLVIPLNLRATFRYVASPGAEFVNTLASANGLALLQQSSNAGIGTATLLFFE